MQAQYNVKWNISHPVVTNSPVNSCFLVICDIIGNKLKVIPIGEILVYADLHEIMVGGVFGAVTTDHEPIHLVWTTSTVTLNENRVT